MFLVIPTNEIKEAPQDIQDWIGRNLLKLNAASNATVQQSSEASQTPPTAAPAKSEDPPEVGEEARMLANAKLLQKAKELAAKIVETKGMEYLGSVIKPVGIENVRNCPPEKLDDLLAALAVA